MILLPLQAIRDVDEFVSLSDLGKCRILSLAQQWILCSEWVPSEWESKQLIKHHNDPQVIQGFRIQGFIRHILKLYRI